MTTTTSHRNVMLPKVLWSSFVVVVVCVNSLCCAQVVTQIYQRQEESQQQWQRQEQEKQREFLAANRNKRTKQFVMANYNNEYMRQPFEYRPFSPPQEAWNARAGAVMDHNGVYMSPDGQLLVSTSINGNVYAFSPQTGEKQWEYTPPTDGLSVRCHSGVTFVYNGPSEYFIYSVLYYTASEDDYDTRVIAVNRNGLERWRSLPVEGIGAGTPVTTLDGNYVFLTHNSHQGTVGHFTVLSPELSDMYGNVYPLYTEYNRTNPFSPPGIYHFPAGGNYEGGEMNNQDIVVWSFAPRPSERSTSGVESDDDDGAVFIFQLPMGNPRQSELFYRQFEEHINWKSISPPVITNLGRTLLWAVSDSQFVVWVDGDRFHEERTESTSFDRGNPLNQACFNTPALSSDAEGEPFVFAGTASTQFVKMDHRLNMLAIHNTASLVKAQAKVVPNDMYVIYTEFNGILHVSQTNNLRDFATYDDFGNLSGEFALSSNGEMVYVGDETGRIQALRIAEWATRAPTTPRLTLRPTRTTPIPPTARPTRVPPTARPVRPTSRPTREPVSQTAQPTAVPTTAPTPPPTPPPTSAPVTAPITATTIAPFSNSGTIERPNDGNGVNLNNRTSNITCTNETLLASNGNNCTNTTSADRPSAATVMLPSSYTSVWPFVVVATVLSLF